MHMKQCKVKNIENIDIRHMNRTRNTLDCEQSNYSSRIVFPSYLLNLAKPNSDIRSANPENPVLEQNME